MTSLDKPTATERPTAAQAAATADAKAVTEAALFEAFGGVRGMVETVVPGLLFVTIFTINKDLHIVGDRGARRCRWCWSWSAWLIRKDTVKHAFSGVFGVAFGVVFAMMTGNAKDFYLPGMLYTLGLAIAYIVTTLAGVPLIGLILGPVFKENLSWRTRNPGRKKAYAKASWAWGLILLAKCAILFPLYWWANTAQLGWVLVALEDPAVPARRLADLGLPGEGAARRSTCSPRWRRRSRPRRSARPAPGDRGRDGPDRRPRDRRRAADASPDASRGRSRSPHRRCPPRRRAARVRTVRAPAEIPGALPPSFGAVGR